MSGSSPSIFGNLNSAKELGIPTNQYSQFSSKQPEFQFVNPTQASQSYVEEHAEAYDRYMVAVRMFEIKIQNARTEKDLELIFLKLSEEFALLDEKYKQIQRKLSHRGIEVICGLSASIVSLTLPDSADMIKYLISSTTAFSGIQYFSTKREMQDQLKTSAYWFPWKLDQEIGS